MRLDAVDVAVREFRSTQGPHASSQGDWSHGPLLQTADGRKMGKTAAGAVWLSPDKLSPFDYWQFWRNRRTPT